VPFLLSYFDLLLGFFPSLTGPDREREQGTGKREKGKGKGKVGRCGRGG
jgi:hypothetical protein